MNENMMVNNEELNEVLDLEEIDVEETTESPNKGFLVGAAATAVAGLVVVGGVKLYKNKIKPWVSGLREKAKNKKKDKEINKADFEDAEDGEFTEIEVETE